MTVSAVVFLVTHAIAVCAEPDAQMPGQVEITGRHVIENDVALKTGRHTFVLTARDDSPMPEGSLDGVKRVTINSNETFRFGAIEYENPGIYSYTVSREIRQTDELEQDDSIYHCVVEADAEGTVVVIFEKVGTQGKPNEILYTDRDLRDEEDESGDGGPTVRTRSSGGRDSPTGTAGRKSGAKAARSSADRAKVSSVKSVRTGDETRLLGVSLILAVGMLALLITIRRRRPYDPRE